MSERRRTNFGLLSFALLFVATNLWAANRIPISEITLDSITQAYRLADDELARARRNDEKLEAVGLYHVGATIPTELTALATKFAASGVKVETAHVTPEQLELMLDHQAERVKDDAWAATKLLRYEAGSTDSEAGAYLRFREKIRTMRDGIKHFFGLPNGVTFATYRTRRAVVEKAIEGSVALGKALFSAQVIYHSVIERSITSGIALNAPFTVAVGLTFGFFFDYFQRGNTAFKGQGWNFDFSAAKLTMNRKFYMFSAFMHSFIMREAMMAAAHITDSGFTMGWNDFFRALSTTSLGLLGRIPVEMWIEKARRNHGKWWTIGVMTAWGIGYSAIQALDMFKVQSVFGLHFGDFFRYTLIALGSTGLTITFMKERQALVDWARRIRDRFKGKTSAQRSRCETLLVVRRKIR